MMMNLTALMIVLLPNSSCEREEKKINPAPLLFFFLLSVNFSFASNDFVSVDLSKLDFFFFFFFFFEVLIAVHLHFSCAQNFNELVQIFHFF